MAYQYLSAIGISDLFDGRYYPIDISTTPLIDVFNEYGSVYVTLLRTHDQQEVTLNLYDLPQSVRFLSITLPQWLTLNANATLPTTDVPPEKKFVFAQFYNAWQHGFSIKPTNRQFHADMDLPEDMTMDAILSKPSANYENLARYCLFTVNGFIHRADWSYEGLVIHDADTTRRISKDNHVGIIDFQHIGPLEFFTITEDMIYKQNDDQPYAESMYIELPKPIGNKIVGAVIMGHLHILDSVCRPSGEATVKLSFGNYPHDRRYYDAKKRIDLSSLGLVQPKEGAYILEQLYSDGVFKQMLLLSQSFIFTIDAEDVHVGRVALEHTKLPGVYQTGLKSGPPVQFAEGRIAEQMTSNQHGRTIIRTRDYLRPRMVQDKGPYREHVNTTEKNISFKPFYDAQAYFLMISKNIDVT